MASPVVQAVSTSAPAGDTATLTLNVPSGTTDGDYLLAVVSAYSNRVITPPSGWTEVEGLADASPFVQIRAYARVASSEPASYNWGLDLARPFGGCMLRIDGQHATTPVDDSASAVDPDTNDTTATMPSVTTTADDTLLVCGYVFTTGTARTFSPPSGMTEQADLHPSGSGGFIHLGVFTETLASSGATGARDATASAQIDIGGIGLSLAIAPAASEVAGAVAFPIALGHAVAGTLTASGALGASLALTASLAGQT
ncbi:MAG TPA: hypothetical protein VF158_02805, partial [Longimicrobiales bacterium]